MRSPFPGMDPFIEACGLWGDFHDKLIGEIERTIAVVLPERYVVRIAERSYVELAESDPSEDRPFEPDVQIRTVGSPHLGAEGTAATTVVAEPATGTLVMHAARRVYEREIYLDIRDSDQGGRLVTSIEVLSPGNKRRGSKGWRQYLQKRRLFITGRANLVELDLLRRGHRLPMVEPWPENPYFLLVLHRRNAPRFLVTPAHYREPLPLISIPLLANDPDLPLALQPLIDAIYQRSRYSSSIQYSKKLRPALNADDLDWLAKQLQTSSGASPPNAPSS